MPAVVDRFPTALLAIAGDGQMRTEVETLITTLGLNEHVLVLGRLTDQELRDWYRAATLFVLPTQELEGFGMSTVEALACGTPAVGTPAGGTPEVLASLDPRLIMPGTSPSEMADGILRLVCDDALLDAVGRRATSHVVPSMSWATIADHHLALYERVAYG
jgi:glycosyltransferase involved in cell wall biosynthesis